MRKWIALLLLVSLLPLSVSFAQDTHYTDATFAFDYPSGWLVFAVEDGSITLSNVELDPDSTYDLPPGSVNLSLFIPNMDEEIIQLEPSIENAEFTAGYWAGVNSGVAVLTTIFSDKEIAFGISAPEWVEVDGNPAILVRFSHVLDQLALLVYRDDMIFYTLNAEAPPGEMEQWELTILEIAATVKLTE